MLFYINSGALHRYGVKTISTEMGFDLRIPNAIDNCYFNLSIPLFGEVNLKEDVIINNCKLFGKDNNYRIVPTSVKYDNVFYALLHCDKPGGDVYIPSKDKDKIKVLRSFFFNTSEVDHDAYLAFFYLVKITLNFGETLPVYFTFKDYHILSEHTSFVNSGKIFIVNNLKTYILLKNDKEYIPISALV